MTRKLALLLAVSLGFWHGAAHALGLGEIAVDSDLNQRFDARIELRNTEALGPNEIIAGLASGEDFARVGVERFFFLSDLQFRTDLSDPARPAIIVSSSQPITEPFVNFVVEVMWPSGRLLREYTVLLDPPTYAAGSVTPARTLPGAGADRARTPAAPARPADSTAASRPDSAPASGDARDAFDGSSYGVTDRDDTLWQVALRVRPDPSLSVQQTMLALVRVNPEAFIGNNINLLKAGYVLRVPDAAEIRRLSFDDAVIQVAQQNDRWRQGLDREPLDARAATAQAGPGASPSDGELRLVAAEDGAQRSTADEQGSARGATAAAGNNGAAEGVGAAELAEARASAAALQDQLAATENRAAELARELELRNEQLARAQEALARQLDAPAAPAPQPAAEGGLFGFGWLTIAAALAALVALVAGVLVLLRRRGDDDDALDAAGDDDVARTQLMPALTAADIAAAGGASAGARDDSEEGEDVIGEADVYMVYGRFSEAARVLNAAIGQDPNRADIRLKLLEVYVESGDVDGFNVQAQALSAFADDETIALADRLATRLPGAMSSSGDVTDGVVAAAPAADASDGEMNLDFDLASTDSSAPVDLDSLDIDLDMDEPAAAKPADRSAAAESDLDFDLDVAGDDDAGGDDAGLDLDGDLDDIDFGLDADNDAPAPAAAPVTRGDAAAADDDDDDDLFGDIEFERDDEPAAGAESDDSGLAKTQLLDSAAVQRALADSDDEGHTGPGEVPDDEFSFDIDDLGADDDVDADADAGADEDAGTAAGTPGSEFLIDDLADPPTSTAADDRAVANASVGADPIDSGADDDDDDATLLGLDLDAGADAGADAGTDADAAEDRTVLATADGDLDFDLDEDEFDFASDEESDEISTKLELARAYVDMGDEDGAREILGEVVRDGDDVQKREAGDLLQQLG